MQRKYADTLGYQDLLVKIFSDKHRKLIRKSVIKFSNYPHWSNALQCIYSTRLFDDYQTYAHCLIAFEFTTTSGRRSGHAVALKYQKSPFSKEEKLFYDPNFGVASMKNKNTGFGEWIDQTYEKITKVLVWHF